MGCRTSSKAHNNLALHLVCQSTLKEFVYKLFPPSNGSLMTSLWRWALDLQSRPPISTSDLDLQSRCLMRARIVMIWLKKGFLIRYSLPGFSRTTSPSVIFLQAIYLSIDEMRLISVNHRATSTMIESCQTSSYSHYKGWTASKFRQSSPFHFFI